MDVGRPGALGETLEALLARGVPLERALPVLTRNVADVLRLPTKGRIAVGADADFATLDDGGRPRDVMALGRFVVRDGVPVVRGTFERAPTKSEPS